MLLLKATNKKYCDIMHIFFSNPESDNEILLEFDSNRYMKISGQGVLCEKLFQPKLDTADVNDRLIGWNQFCFTMAKADTYSVNIRLTSTIL